MPNTYFDPLISRICQIAKDRLRNSDDGLVVVSFKVLIGKDGRPLLWSEPACVKLEPPSRAAAFLEAISDTG